MKTLNKAVALGILLSLSACSDDAQFAAESGPPVVDAVSGDGTQATDPNQVSDGTSTGGIDTGTETGTGTSPGTGTEIKTENGVVVNEGNVIIQAPPVKIEDAAIQLQERCKQGVTKSLVQAVRFPEMKGCRFEKNSNLGRLDAHLQAIEAQSSSIQLPSQAQLCKLEIGSAATTIQYDDFMILTLNGYVLLSSNTAFLQGLESDGTTAYKWDFGKIKGVAVDFSSPQYCLGAASSVCEVPVTDVPGSFKFNIDPASLSQVADKIVDVRNLNFALYASGDNDDKDCWHTEFTLNFTVHYVE